MDLATEHYDQSKEFCNLIRRIREAVRLKEADLRQDECIQLKKDLLNFIHNIANDTEQKQHDYVCAFATISELLIRFFG